MKGKVFIWWTAALALVAQGGVPVARTVDVGAAIKPIALEAYAGETLDLAMQLTSGGAALATPAAAATLYWQTNGMAGAWWSTNLACSAAGLVTGAWTPSLPAGRVWFFAGVESAGLNYRIAGQLTVRPSPGGSPSTATLPPPGGTLNLGDYTVIGAPWITSADAATAIGAATEPLAGEVAALGERVAAAAQAGTNYTDAAAAGLGEQIAALGGRVDAQGVALGNATNALNARIDGIVVPDVSGFATKGELQSASNALAGAVQAVSIGVENASNALAQATAQLAQTVADNAQQGGYDLAAASNALAQAMAQLAQTVAENAQQGGYDLAATSNALAQTVAANAQQSGYDLAAASNALAQATEALAQTVADLAVATTASNTAYRLATLDDQTYQDATGVVWRASVVTNLSPWFVSYVGGEPASSIPGVSSWSVDAGEYDGSVQWLLRIPAGGGIVSNQSILLSTNEDEDVSFSFGGSTVQFSRTNEVTRGVWTPIDRVLYASGGGGEGLTTNDVCGIVTNTVPVGWTPTNAPAGFVVNRVSWEGDFWEMYYSYAGETNMATDFNSPYEDNELSFECYGNGSTFYVNLMRTYRNALGLARLVDIPDAPVIQPSLTTNDVCAIVTNMVSVVGDWTFASEPPPGGEFITQFEWNAGGSNWLITLAPSPTNAYTWAGQAYGSTQDAMSIEGIQLENASGTALSDPISFRRVTSEKNALGLAMDKDLPQNTAVPQLLMLGAGGTNYILKINSSGGLDIYAR